MKLNKHNVIVCILLLYTALLLYWMFFGFGRQAQTEYRYNLQPFSTIDLFIRSKSLRKYHFVINVLGNIGVFIPFGILLPGCFKGSLVKAAIVLLSGLLVLEFLQLVCKRGTFDVDDIILNTGGFIIGYILEKLIRWFWQHHVFTAK
ncbi:MAG: VanZ family protein [Treponema sp.]|nr:VanZ family protein [Treponema sp.]